MNPSDFFVDPIFSLTRIFASKRTARVGMAQKKETA